MSEQPPYGPPPNQPPSRPPNQPASQSPYGPPPGQSPGQSPYGQSPYGPPPGHSAGQPAGQSPYGPPPAAGGPGQPPAYGPPPTPPPPGGWDYAQFGGGGQPPRPRNTRKWLLGGGAVVAAAALIGGGAFAAAAILGGDDDLGPQPAEALPTSTFAYASIDVDPSDGEKGEAIKTMLKFPAVQKRVKLGQSDDLRQKLIESILDEEGDTCGGLTWEKDFKPWLGTKAAVAGVDVSGKATPVFVVQVTDKAKAQAEFDKLKQCGGGDSGGIAISGDWALVGESQDTITKLADDAKSQSLADDSSYQKWTGDVGSHGAFMAYAAPSAGDMIAKALESSLSFASSSGSDSAYSSSLSLDSDDFATACSDPTSVECQAMEFESPQDQFLQDVCPGLGSNPGGAMNQLESTFKDFGGGAATLRFKDGGVEAESAVDFGQTGTAGQNADDLVGSLPDDTAAAVGISVGANWFDSVLDNFAAVCGPGFDRGRLESQLSQLTGLSFPDDINTLLGKGMALSLGSGLDPSSLDSPADLPFALSIKGDSAAIQAVLDKIKAKVGNADQGVLDSDAKGDVVAVGPSSSYRSKVLGNGGLGSDGTFTDVVPHASDSSVIVYVNFDQFDHIVSQEAGSDALADFKPLKALGMSGWLDGTTSHSFIRLSTD